MGLQTGYYRRFTDHDPSRYHDVEKGELVYLTGERPGGGAALGYVPRPATPSGWNAHNQYQEAFDGAFERIQNVVINIPPWALAGKDKWEWEKENAPKKPDSTEEEPRAQNVESEEVLPPVFEVLPPE